MGDKQARRLGMVGCKKYVNGIIEREQATIHDQVEDLASSVSLSMVQTSHPFEAVW